MDNNDKYYYYINASFIGNLTDNVTDFMATNITSTTITLSWSPPTLVPISYEIERRCSRLCESSFGGTESDLSVTSPHQSTGITPYTECDFSLIGVYGAENVYLATNYLATTPFAGKVLCAPGIINILLLQYLSTQLLLYQSVISHSHQWSQCQ